MPKQRSNKKKVVAVVQDLMFTVKISEAAKKAGLPVEFVQSEEDVLDKAKQNPTAIIFDLNMPSVNALKLIRELKKDANSKKISLIAYLSHVQGELKRKALDAGCDIVMTRSAFSQNLPSLLKRHADVY